jgi:hypothetical protein
VPTNSVASCTINPQYLILTKRWLDVNSDSGARCWSDTFRGNAGVTVMQTVAQTLCFDPGHSTHSTYTAATACCEDARVRASGWRLSEGRGASDHKGPPIRNAHMHGWREVATCRAVLMISARRRAPRFQRDGPRSAAYSSCSVSRVMCGARARLARRAALPHGPAPHRPGWPGAPSSPQLFEMRGPRGELRPV